MLSTYFNPLSSANSTSYFIKALSLMLMLSLGACSSSRKLEPIDLEDFAQEASFDTLWSKKISGGQGEYYHQFRLQDDRQHIYAASESGRIFKLLKESNRIEN